MTLSRRHLIAAGASLPLAAPSLALAQAKESASASSPPTAIPGTRPR